MSGDKGLPEKVLIVDDDPQIVESMKASLSRHNIKVLGATDLETALYHFNQNRLDAAVIELEFEPNPGLVMIQKWRKHEVVDKRHTGFIVTTGNRLDQRNENFQLIKELKDIEVINKPFTDIQLLPYLQRAKATKMRNIKFEEVRDTVLKLAVKNFDKSIDVLKKQLPELGQKGLELMCDLYQQHNKMDDAFNMVKKMVESDPKNLVWQNHLATLHIKRGEHKEALKVFEKIDKESPDHIDRVAHMADTYLKEGRPDESMEKMRQLIKLHPENNEMNFDMFGKLYDHGFDAHAHKLCHETTSPIEVVRYYNNKGVALSKGGATDKAIVEYTRSLGFYPKFKENYRILYNIALAHTALKTRESYQKALEILEQCLVLQPDFDKGKQTKQKITEALAKGDAAFKAG